MDSRIALAANTQLHFQNKEGGAVRYTIIKEIGRGGSCIVYDASYETNTRDIKYVRIKECYPFRLRIERESDGTLSFFLKLRIQQTPLWEHPQQISISMACVSATPPGRMIPSIPGKPP